MFKIVPLEDNLLVRLEAPVKMTAQGVVLPDDQKDKRRHLRAEVLAVGPGKFEPTLGKRREVPISVGQTIIVDRPNIASESPEPDDKELRLIGYDAIWAVLEPVPDVVVKK